jgi:hypothetical protein
MLCVNPPLVRPGCNSVCIYRKLLACPYISFILKSRVSNLLTFNPLNAELNPICHLLALLGAHLIFHVSRIRVKNRASYIYRTDVPLPYVVFYIFFSTNISTEYFKHAAHSPFFSSKCRLFHNATFFGSCVIHILHRVC